MGASRETSVLNKERRFFPTGQPWLLSARVTIPGQVDGYMRRPQLLSRCRPLDRRLTVFQAPCGFGKTTLLADICRRQRAMGVLTPWLRLDEADSLNALTSYIGFALERAGLDVSVLRSAAPNFSKVDNRPDHERPDHRLGLLMRAIDDYRKPCLFALDEVERLADTEQVRAIDFLLKRAPRNVHFSMSMRNSPRGLDLATAILDQRGAILGAEDLRFSKPEIALFFDGQLSRPELTEMTERTEGWPAALRVHHNMRTGVSIPGESDQSPGSHPVQGYAGIAARLIASRLRRDWKDEERSYLLDVALFDVIELAIVDEVLPEAHRRSGAEVLSKLDGLVHSVGTSAGVLRLHPLVREYCAARRFQEAPSRYRMLHGRIAMAMARRNRLDSALRHASESGDHALLGRILEGVGGARLWATHGMQQLLSAERFLKAEMLADFPRLALLRCAALVARSELHEGLALYRAVREQTAGFRRDRDGGDDHALWIDNVLVKSTLVIFGCQPLGDVTVRTILADVRALAVDEQLDPAARGLLYTILCSADYQRARFESSHWLGTQAKQYFMLAGARYGAVFNDFHRGMAAMAEGRVEDAAQTYSRRSPALITQVLLAELYLERNQLKSHRRLGAASVVPLRNVEKWLDIHAAAYGVAAELALEREGVSRALQVVEEGLNLARSDSLPSLARHLSALRASYLVIDGQVESAIRMWQTAGLPDDPSRLLDLDDQTWREMESLSCARLRLLAAQGEFEAARRLAERFEEVARSRGLMRSLMRCIALWMSLEYRAGNMNAAATRLLEFLRLLRIADYARPLVREREVSAELLRRVLGTALNPALRASAESLLRQMGSEDAGRPARTSRYTARELEVLEHLNRGLRDKEIARHLGLTEHGVRYHLKNIFRKTGAVSRLDAVRRARELGLGVEP